jgi:photosystem II stability/assembly factor-like uncharacterized protein
MVQGVPGQPDSFLFAGAGGGIWRTDDAGRTWRAQFTDGPPPVGFLAIAPSNPDIIYAGTGQPEPRYDVAAGGGVYRSADGGKTWKALGLAETRYIGRIWVHPTDPNTLLVGAVGHFFGPNPERGVYRSTDGGASWTQTLKIDEHTGVSDLAADPRDPNVVFAASWTQRQWPWQSHFMPVAGENSALWRSGDGGVTWTRLGGKGWPTGPLGRISVAATHAGGGALRLYAVVDSPDKGGLYRSDDGGASWTRVQSSREFTSWYQSRITIDPADPDTVYLVGQSIRKCTKGGTACEIFRGSPGGDDYHFVWIDPVHPGHMATASDQGTAISVDGGKTWSDWYNQPTGQFYHLATDNQFPYRIYSGQQDSGTVGIASRSDYGQITIRDWTPVGGDERDYDIPDPKDPQIVYSSGLGGRVSRWDARTGQVANVAPYPVSTYGKRQTATLHHFVWVTPLVSSITGPATLYLGGEVVFASKDRGDHWSIISPDLTGKMAGAQRCDGDVQVADAKACGYGGIWSIAPSPRHADEIWVGADDGMLSLTRDGGAHWTTITPPGVKDWWKIASIDVSALEDGVAYIAVDGQRLDDFQPHVFKTRDYGANWTEISAGLPAGHFASVVRADPVRKGLLYEGDDTSVHVSFDDGAHWQGLQQNLPTAWIRDLTVHGNDLIAATEGRAIWALDDVSPLRQLTPAIAAEPAHLFAPAMAYRVHPNNNKDTPLAPETPAGTNPPAGAIIDYWLGAAAKGPVTIEIRDAKGQVVRRLTSESQPRPNADAYFADIYVHPKPPLSTTPGMHRVAWDLHGARPRSIGFEYAIAAIAGQDTPALPEGPFAPPGDYTVVLKVDGKEQRAPLKLVEDPRVPATQADLEASWAFSQSLSRGMDKSWRGLGETSATHAQLEKLAKSLAGSKPTLAAQAKALADAPAAAADRAAFGDANSVLAALEADAEGGDGPPLEAQKTVAAEAVDKIETTWAHWGAWRNHELAAFNAELKTAGLKPVVPPAEGQLKVEAPDEGQDLP